MAFPLLHTSPWLCLSPCSCVSVCVVKPRFSNDVSVRVCPLCADMLRRNAARQVWGSQPVCGPASWPLLSALSDRQRNPLIRPLWFCSVCPTQPSRHSATIPSLNAPGWLGRKSLGFPNSCCTKATLRKSPLIFHFESWAPASLSPPCYGITHSCLVGYSDLPCCGWFELFSKLKRNCYITKLGVWKTKQKTSKFLLKTYPVVVYSTRVRTLVTGVVVSSPKCNSTTIQSTSGHENQLIYM